MIMFNAFNFDTCSFILICLFIFLEIQFIILNIDIQCYVNYQIIKKISQNYGFTLNNVNVIIFYCFFRSHTPFFKTVMFFNYKYLFNNINYSFRNVWNCNL